jgi:hypothetical protein
MDKAIVTAWELVFAGGVGEGVAPLALEAAFSQPKAVNALNKITVIKRLFIDTSDYSPIEN